MSRRRLSLLLSGDEWIGLFVVVALLAFVGAVLQAGVLREWVAPSARLRVLLPEEGVGGIVAGSEVEVLGTRAGTVRSVVISRGQRFHAEVALDRQAAEFVRRDSIATIRRRFGVAGAAFLDISRGVGAPLDWDFAVIEAVSERAPTETVGALIDELRDRVFPILDEVQRAVRSLANAMERLDRGEGAAGRLLSDAATAEEIGRILAEGRRLVSSLAEIAAGGERLAETLTGEEGIPALLRRADRSLAEVQRVTRDLARATQRAPAIARGAQESVEVVPALLLQAQATARELEALTLQLRGLWLLGGGGAPAERQRLPAERIRP